MLMATKNATQLRSWRMLRPMEGIFGKLHPANGSDESLQQ